MGCEQSRAERRAATERFDDALAELAKITTLWQANIRADVELFSPTTRRTLAKKRSWDCLVAEIDRIERVELGELDVRVRNKCWRRTGQNPTAFLCKEPIIYLRANGVFCVTVTMTCAVSNVVSAPVGIMTPGRSIDGAAYTIHPTGSENTEQRSVAYRDGLFEQTLTWVVETNDGGATLKNLCDDVSAGVFEDDTEQRKRSVKDRYVDGGDWGVSDTQTFSEGMFEDAGGELYSCLFYEMSVGDTVFGAVTTTTTPAALFSDDAPSVYVTNLGEAIKVLRWIFSSLQLSVAERDNAVNYWLPSLANGGTIINTTQLYSEAFHLTVEDVTSEHKLPTHRISVGIAPQRRLRGSHDANDLLGERASLGVRRLHRDEAANCAIEWGGYLIPPHLGQDAPPSS